MLKEKKYFYKAKRVDTGETVIGRVGTTKSSSDGIEKTIYFNQYIGDNCDNADWSICVVDANSIEQLS